MTHPIRSAFIRVQWHAWYGRHQRAIVAYSVLGVLSVGTGVAIACAPLAPMVPSAPSAGNRAVSAAASKQPTRTAVRPPAPTVSDERAGTLGGRDRMASIALAGGLVMAKASATGAWDFYEQGGRLLLVRGQGREPWQVERKGLLLRVTGAGGDATPWRVGPFVARPSDGATLVQYGGRRYRGELWFSATDSGVLVVNRLSVEDYLRGVVPLELGTRAEGDRSALEAQAVAARSYSYVRVPRDDAPAPASGYHMLASVSNQVYGGVEAESPLVNSAIDATAGLVIRYGGLLVDAPYSSSCGGHTASPQEAWRDGTTPPYLQGVDDTNPATRRPYCDISPRANWTASFDESELGEVVKRHLRSLGSASPSSGAVAGLRVDQRFASGRVRTLQVETDRGDVKLEASEIRALFRDTRGAILSSTYFSVDREPRDGHLTRVTLRGTGNGHGVGMCQWGAIGRARAGQDFRAILRHYYPGTVVGFMD